MHKFQANAVTWFEIPTSDFERATNFYEFLLEDDMRPFPGAEPCNMFPAGEGGVGGCIVYRPQHKPASDGTLVYLNVDGRLDDVIHRAAQRGSQVLVPRTPIPGGFGSFAVFTDSEGNHVGLHTR